MLTDEQKRTIRLEEAYRAELREEMALRRRRGLPARIWGLVNANIVVWFLGSVVVTGIVIYVDGREQRRAIEQLQQKLDTEIAARLYRARGYLKKLEGGEATVLNVADVLRSTGPVRDQPYPMGVFSEFNGRTLESLLWELAATVHGEERAQVRAAMDAARTLSDIEGEIETRMARDPDLKCRFILRIYRELDASFALERWDIARAEPVLDEGSGPDGCTIDEELLIGTSVGKD